MKLRAKEVERVTDRLLLEWKNQKLVSFKAPESNVRARLIEIFLGNLKAEDDLNTEVEQMLAKYEKQFESGQLDRHKMFQMVKNQIIKERKLII